MEKKSADRLSLHDEQGFLDLFMITLIAVAVVLVFAFLLGGIIAFFGALLAIGGFALMFFGFEMTGLIAGGIGVVLLLASTQLHMGLIQLICAIGGL